MVATGRAYVLLACSATTRSRREQRLQGTPDEVFPFFADAGNLEAITPPWLGFEVVTPRPIEMRVGALIEYRLTLHRLPIRWLTRIEEWVPGERFVDAQLGPVQALAPHARVRGRRRAHTLMRDTVRYALPFGPLGGARAPRVRGARPRADLRLPDATTCRQGAFHARGAVIADRAVELVGRPA